MAGPPAAAILVVEGDPGAALLQRRHLERAGYTVREADTADAAVGALRGEAVALVLLDYLLPGGETGLHLLDRLRAERPDVPVILITGHSDEATVIEALRAGVRDFIVKSPDYLTHLPAAVGRVLAAVRTERQLAESEARLAAIIGSARDAVIVVESDGTVSLFNAAAVSMFQCSAADAGGRHVAEFIPYEVVGDEPGGNPLTGATARMRTGTHGRRSDGTVFPVERSVSRVEVGGRKFYALLVRDVTQRVEAERRLRQAARLLDQSSDAILVIDLGGTIRFWNGGAERLYGWPAAHAVGHDAARLLADDPPEAREEAVRAARARRPWAGELRHATRAGLPVTVVSRWTPVSEDGGEPTVLIANTDVTERRALEKQMQRAQRLESLGVLAGGIAHDLNNVLTPILMASELLLGRTTDPDGRALLGMLRDSTERGAELIRQILTFARGAEGQPQPVQLGPLAKEVAKLLAQTFPRSIRIVEELAKDLWFVKADTTQIHQVLMNLGLNARDAMPGGGTLTIAARNIELGADAAGIDAEARPGRYVVLAVEDAGCGIPPENLGRLFEPFFTTKEPGKGTGLGLPTTQRIVKSCGGFMRVESRVGAGTRFEVYLPAIDLAHAPVAAVAAAPPPAAHGELVLVVDDEASIREVTRAILEAGGYQVLLAANGAEGVELFRRHRDKIRVVLTDMAMPVMDGAATARALLDIDPGVRIISSSGEPNPEGKPRVPGARATLPKPFSVESLLQTVRAVIES